MKIPLFGIGGISEDLKSILITVRYNASEVFVHLPCPSSNLVYRSLESTLRNVKNLTLKANQSYLTIQTLVLQLHPPCWSCQICPEYIEYVRVNSLNSIRELTLFQKLLEIPLGWCSRTIKEYSTEMHSTK